MLVDVYHDIPILQHIAAAVCPAQHHLHPRQQFHGLEGLDDIILGPQAQALHLIRNLLLGGEKNNGNLLGPNMTDDLKAVHTGQHHIQQHHVVMSLQDFLHRLQTVAADAALIASNGQSGLNHPGDVRIILHNTYPRHTVHPFFASQHQSSSDTFRHTVIHQYSILRTV